MGYLDDKGLSHLWGKVKARLAAKQDTLTGQPSEVVGFNSDGAAQAVRGWSNPNLLLNWDFRRPVNRNGQAEYVGACRSIDGWINATSGTVVKVLDGEIELSTTETAANIGVLREIIEDAHLYSGREITISALVNGVLYSASGKVPSTLNSVDPVAIVYIAPDIYCGVLSLGDGTLAAQFKVPALGALPHIRAIKVELSGHQTLARQNEDGEWEIVDPPDYDLQYALCSLYSPSTGEWVGYQHSNPHLEDNWYFSGPINQRAETSGEFGTTAGYFIDRWFSARSKIGLTSGGLSLAWNGVDSSDGWIQQKIERPDCIGQIVTFSFLADHNLYTCTGTVPPQKGASFSKTFEGGLFATVSNWDNTIISCLIGSKNTVPIITKACKLELGPVQTLAHKEGDTWVLNDPPPNKALELAKCQRYQVKSEKWFRCRAAAVFPNYIDFFIPLPVTPRASTNTIPNDIFTLDRIEQSGFSLTHVYPTAAGLQVRFTKNAHGLTDAHLLVDSGFLFDFNL